ncbi:hypothetical protein RCO28_32275 [Streptomyces sp. LHD-70]|uniref:hypothetical protein n=1 Tax=Streptomyces sp. LHD-70 TaxID=3072140 RepID=UPI00280E388B|nr:hypothetical protein [Streptomyces sp. LHD-70]MDQ8707116.1 hypothetical protein [Streptomyces sp. LHD-70]
MDSTASDVVRRLGDLLAVQVNSSPELFAGMEKAAAAVDRERAKKTTNEGHGPRKPGLRQLPRAERAPLRMTPWDLISTFARATTLARQGRGRGLAEHWQGLKYCRAFTADRHGSLRLTDEGKAPELSYRAMQARELGRAFGLAVAERALRERYPDHLISLVDAETALLPGFARTKPAGTLGARPRPDFLLEAWRPGEGSRIFVVTVNGNHQAVKPKTSASARTTYRQLARGSERVERLHLGQGNETPTIMTSTEFLATAGVTVHVLHTTGGVELPVRPTSGPESADVAIGRRALRYADSVAIPTKRGVERHNAFLIPEEQFSWFGRVIARAHAAGQLSLAGGGGTVGRYLIDEQGGKHFSETAFAGTASVHDAKTCFGEEQYVGTDQVFRINGTRVEAFSGIATELYDLLAEGKVEEYRQRVYERRKDWPEPDDIDGWGASSFRPDGTALAIRVLPNSASSENLSSG